MSANKSEQDNKHPWEDLEPLFQLLYKAQPDSPAWRQGARQLKPALRRGATGLLLKKTADNAEGLARAVVDEWLTKLTDLFAKYDASRPFFPFGYLTFQRLCGWRCRRPQERRIPGLTHDPLDPRSDPIRNRLRGELRDRLGAAMWRLPHDQRQVIVRQWKEVPLDNLARRDKCTLNALYIRASRARQQLCQWLAEFARFFRKKR